MEVKYLSFSLFVCTLLLSNCNSFGIDNDEPHTTRQGKLFSLFSIVKFENGECESSITTTSGSNRNGTCFTSSECGDKGGSSKGSCAAGFGVCCVFIIDDSTTTSVTQNDTYIQNPGYPTMYGETNSLSYTVSKVDDDICFLRLDFEDFTILGPSNSFEFDEGLVHNSGAGESGGKCYADYITITPPSSSGQTVPQICGKNTGQHLYVSMGSSSTDTVGIAFSFAGDSTTRKWDIKVAQIECGMYAPPDGCLQYYTGISGQIMTFNFLDDTTSHLALQDYNICMRREQGYCCIQYQVCDESTYADPFSIYRKDIDTNAISLVETECTEDYISIAGGQGVCTTNVQVAGNAREKFCGGRFTASTGANAKANAPVCDCTAPFQVGVMTDNTEDPQDASAAANAAQSRGVCLEFQQKPC